MPFFVVPVAVAVVIVRVVIAIVVDVDVVVVDPRNLPLIFCTNQVSDR